MTYTDGLRRAARHALATGNDDDARRLLELGVAYGFDGLPREAVPLWKAKLALEVAATCVAHPECFTDAEATRVDRRAEAVRLLEEP